MRATSADSNAAFTRPARASTESRCDTVRPKGVSDRVLFELTSRVVDLCAAHDAACIVNDRVDVALATGAHGAHVGADDLPVDAARAVLGDEAILGATARDPATARAHEA